MTLFLSNKLCSIIQIKLNTNNYLLNKLYASKYLKIVDEKADFHIYFIKICSLSNILIEMLVYDYPLVCVI